MRVYIAGPMRGRKDFNFPAFADAARRGRALGHDVVSPHELDTADGFDPTTDAVTPEFIRAAARRDLDAIQTCDAIALLPGWDVSTGAKAELAVAKWLTLKVLDATTFEPFTETALDVAKRICYGDRNADYGHPFEECERMAALWGVVLGIKITPEQVCLCLIQMKVSRLLHSTKADSIIDVAGYAECLWRIAERRKELEA